MVIKSSQVLKKNETNLNFDGQTGFRTQEPLTLQMNDRSELDNSLYVDHHRPFRTPLFQHESNGLAIGIKYQDVNESVKNLREQRYMGYSKKLQLL